MSTGTHAPSAPVAPVAPTSTLNPAMRVLRFLLRQWWGYLAGALVIAVALIALRVTGILQIVGEQPGTWWGFTGTAAAAFAIAATVFAAVIPGTYFRTAYAAGATRGAMALGWAMMGGVVLATTLLAVLLIDAVGKALAGAGLGASAPDARIVIDFPGLTEGEPTAPLGFLTLFVLAALVLGPAITAVFLRFRWWVGALISVLALPVLSLASVALAQDGLSVLEVVVSVAVLAVVAAVAVALLRSTPVALAIDRP